MKINDIIAAQRDFFQNQSTKTLKFRKAQLYKLKTLIKHNEKILHEAIKKDLNKSFAETYQTEFSLIYQELNFYLKNLKKLLKPQKVSGCLATFPSKNLVIKEPFGLCLIIGAWNYPYQLTLMPLIAAIAAGNTSIIKPSELGANTALALESLINDNFPAEYLYVQTGNVDTCTKLLSYNFDYIFFTGSSKVGKIIAASAAKNLTPITLELGGKSPCFILQDANLELSAKRIIWGKFLNAGQTCIAPDYLLVEQKIYTKFLKTLKTELEKQNYTKETYPNIIDAKHYERLLALITPEKILSGGETYEKSRTIMPTLLKDIAFTDKIMEEEIFGPLLPIIPFTNLSKTLEYIKQKPKALSCYIFTKNRVQQDFIINNLDFGSACINDLLLQAANHHLPFGGIGESGMGRYHGKEGFDTFTYKKSIMKRPFWGDWPLRYPPFTKGKLKLLKFLLG